MNDIDEKKNSASDINNNFVKENLRLTTTLTNDNYQKTFLQKQNDGFSDMYTEYVHD